MQVLIGRHILPNKHYPDVSIISLKEQRLGPFHPFLASNYFLGHAAGWKRFIIKRPEHRELGRLLTCFRDKAAHLRLPSNIRYNSESSVSIASSICKCQPSAKGIVPDADVLNTEFMYYSAVLRIFASSLIKESDRVNAQLWMKKLFGPTYHSTLLKPKRNKYLLYLTITLYNDETFGIFKEEPPSCKLPDVQSLPFGGECPPASWEQETQWCDTLNDLPDYFKYSECYLHKTCPEYEECYGAMLDASFNFFLWLIRPYIALMTDTEDKTKAACWVQTLCGLGPEKGDCPGLKELRNEYIIALLGYVHDLRVEGPFHEMPPEGPLMTLEDSVKKFRERNPCGGPVGAEAEEFLSHQPLPETGAFAYISVAGSMFKN